MPSKYCLIIDDSPTVTKVTRRILEKCDFEIDAAENGQIGLEKCEARIPDVILLDWNMPVMNGIDFLRTLRATYSRTKPQVIFCTTEGSVDHIREAMEAGADDYIIKPFDRATLRAKLGLADAVPA